VWITRKEGTDEEKTAENKGCFRVVLSITALESIGEGKVVHEEN
jgi:hypothetical protein